MTESPPTRQARREALLAQAVDEFMSACRAGERPRTDDYAARYPDVADELRHVLAALLVMEPSGGDLPPTDPALAMGTIGDYRIIREVGRGGMGVVYEAEQLSLGRSVALKVLPFAATMDPKQLQRFKNEARAAASLEHEHIVPVYGVGSERGVHYYAMKFIAGTTLASLIRDLHHADTITADGDATDDYVPGNASTLEFAGLSTESTRDETKFFRSTARLMIQAAEALEHAHSMGVVHRDIKPGNLMLDAAGNLWVTDFGLARVAADAGLTISGDLVGTLRYMAPEQAMARHGLVDYRTDIYALGATLYELLTGRPVVAGTDKHEILRQIAFEEPPPPRTWNKSIPGDLETIVLKAIEKNSADRYVSAKEVVEDLQRFLDGEAIRAKRPTIVKRASKWARRHRAVLATALAALVVLSIGSGLAAGRVLIAQRHAADRDAETQAVFAFVEKHILSAARPKGPAGGLGHEVTLRQAIEASLPSVESEFAGRPLIEARLRITLGESFRRLGDDGHAMQQFQRAYDLYSEHRGADHPDTITSLNKLANSLAADGQAEAALRSRFEAYRHRKATLGEDHPATLDSANNLAISLDDVGRFQEALALREDTLTRRKAVNGPDHHETLTAMNNLAISYHNLGRHDEALKLREKTLAKRRAQPVPDTEGVLAGMHNLAESLHAAGREAEARTLYEETLQKATVELPARTPQVMNNLAWLLATAEDAKVRDPKRAVELAEQVVNTRPKNPGHLGTLGTARYRAGDYQRAAVNLEQAINLRGDDPANANESFFLAMARVQLGDRPVARDWFAKGVAWMNQSKTRTDELRRFRAEAANLLGITDQAEPP